MNGERLQVNGQHLLNGATSTQHHQATEAKISRIDPPAARVKTGVNISDEPYTNGVLPNGSAATELHDSTNGLQQAPLEVLQLIGRENYLPISTIIHRAAQNCWNGLSALVDHLSTIAVPQQSPDPTKSSSAVVNNQTKANLDKKDRILNFANDQKSNFIKLLVLLQWSRNGEDVSKAMNLNFWLMTQRFTYLNTCEALARLMQEAPNFQIPNPDLKTAAEVLALGRATSFPDVGYQIVTPLKRRQILSTLRRLDWTLSVRLALEENIPPQLQNYHIHDGRATFVIANEFELDLSVMDESPTSTFRVVDVRFVFSPRPAIPDNRFQQIADVANSEIDREGLKGCYDFIHDLTLTTKLTEYYKQAIALSRNQWAGHLYVKILRRDLVVQYWRRRDSRKSWIEISIRSGRDDGQSTDSLRQPYLAVRWFREGKEVGDFDLEMDVAEISFESILLQIVAQDISHTLDSVYDRISVTELFGEDGLLVEQSTSAAEPTECVLEVQLTKKTKIAASIDAVSGLIMISPASDRANRLQLDLNRSKNVIEEFVPRLLNFRCALAEESILWGIRDTCWQRLDASKPTPNDIRVLFGASIVRVNFFRHPLWSNKYLLAITNSINGDRLWILQQSAKGKAASLASFQMLQEQRIGLHHDLSTTFFESVADYASGVVVLHSNAERLQAISALYKLPRLPEFEDNYVFPAISFAVLDGKVSTEAITPTKAAMGRRALSSGTALANTVRVFYRKTDALSKSAKLSVEVRCHMEAAVMERLAASNTDNNTNFMPQEGRVILEVSTVLGQSAIDEIVQRVTRLNDVIACIRTVQSLSYMELVSVSMTALTIAFKFDQTTESRMVVRFPGRTEAARLEFLPPGVDPHDCLVPQLSQLLADPRRSFASNLNSALSSLNLTHPLIMALDELQHTTSDGTQVNEAARIRLHVFARQPTMFALQFFTSTVKGLAENTTAVTHQRVLARFEILPSSRHEGQWLLRPAIEELNAYTRASFAATTLRDKVKDEIFAKKGPCPDWIRLDVAAVCLKDKPQPLLKTLHGLIVDWVKSNAAVIQTLPMAEKPEAKKEQQQAPASAQVNGHQTANRKASQQPAKTQITATTNSNTQHKGKHTGGNKAQAPPKTKEVITLD